MHGSHFRQRVWKVGGSRKSPLVFSQQKKFRKSCSGHAGMWNVSSGKTWGPDRHRGPFLTRKEPLTCQSRHSSVNRSLILCWKLVGCRISKADRRLKVEWMTIPPPDSESIHQSYQHSWLRGKNLIVFLFFLLLFFFCETRHLSF